MDGSPEQTKGAEDTVPQKESVNQNLWQKKVDEFSHVADELGEPIDPGVFDAVVALNLFDVNTRQSCEGHSDSDGIRPPWIDIESPESASLEKIYDEKQNDEALKEVRAVNLQEAQKLTPFLDDFYRGRDVSAERRLVLRPFGMGTTRVESQGAAIYQPLTPKQLMDCQKEMHDFGEYLKQKFLAS